MNTPVLIPARNDVQSWKTLLDRCPKWLLCMEFTKAVSRSEKNDTMQAFFHPSCVSACQKVVDKAKDAPRPSPKKDSKPLRIVRKKDQKDDD